MRFPPPQQHQQLGLASKGALHWAGIRGCKARVWKAGSEAQVPHCPALRGEDGQVPGDF